MSPKLYMIVGSPPVRAVQVTAKVLGLDLDLIELDLMNKQHLTPEYLKINPQHTVPALVDDDGFALWDSHAIMPYLVSKYGKNDDLYPKDVKVRAVIDQRLHFDSGVLWPQILKMIRPILFSGKKTIDQEDKDALNTGFDFLNTFLDGKQWVAGNSVTIADFSIACTVSAIVTIIPLDSKKFPNVAKWLKHVDSLPAWEVSKKGIKAFEGLFKPLLD